MIQERPHQGVEHATKRPAFRLKQRADKKGMGRQAAGPGLPGLIARQARQECRERAEAILLRVGLQDRLRHRPGELSGGEQQRVALARALSLSPRLLLGDEPTGNLDTKTGRGIHDLFFELNRELGMTLLLVTHNDELAGRAFRKLRMVDGRIQEEG